MILLKRTKRFGKRSDRIKNGVQRLQSLHTSLHMQSLETLHSRSAQVREHIRAVVIVPHARAIESIKVRQRKRRSRNGQSNRHFQPLLASQTHATLTSLICVFIAKTTSAFHAGSERRILATMRHQITNDHFTLHSGFVCHENCSPH